MRNAILKVLFLNGTSEGINNIFKVVINVGGDTKWISEIINSAKNLGLEQSTDHCDGKYVFDSGYCVQQNDEPDNYSSEYLMNLFRCNNNQMQSPFLEGLQHILKTVCYEENSNSATLAAGIIVGSLGIIFCGFGLYWVYKKHQARNQEGELEGLIQTSEHQTLWNKLQGTLSGLTQCFNRVKYQLLDNEESCCCPFSGKK